MGPESNVDEIFKPIPVNDEGKHIKGYSIFLEGELPKFLLNEQEQNMTEYYKAYRIVDGKPRWVIVDENGKIINNNLGKEELKDLEKEPRKAQDTRKYKRYTDEELLNYLQLFYKENGRVPKKDFDSHPEYPTVKTYIKRFGGWNKALKLVGLDVDTMVKQGNLQNEYQKSRLSEILVRDHFKNNPTDLSGKNQKSPCDGICPNGKTYDVKSAGLLNQYAWNFHISNKYKEDIEIFYLLAFNADYTKLLHAWRVPGEIIEKENFYIGTTSHAEFTIENMKKYEITDKLEGVVSKVYLAMKKLPSQ